MRTIEGERDEFLEAAEKAVLEEGGNKNLPYTKDPMILLAYGMLWHANGSFLPKSWAYALWRVLKATLSREEKGDGITMARRFKSILSKRRSVK